VSSGKPNRNLLLHQQAPQPTLMLGSISPIIHIVRVSANVI
jgi:hypothetical protein